MIQLDPAEEQTTSRGMLGGLRCDLIDMTTHCTPDLLQIRSRQNEAREPPLAIRRVELNPSTIFIKAMSLVTLSQNLSDCVRE